MYPMRCRTARSTGRPSQRTSPESASSTPSTIRIVVDLPAPLEPTKPTISPARTSIDRSRSARTSPYVLFRDSIVSAPMATIETSVGGQA